jgi:hypothetical protein
MKIYIFTLLLLLNCIFLKAQFIYSIEFNNGINLSSNELKKSITDNAMSDPLISPTNYKNNLLIGISSAIKLNYFNHYYWNLSSQIGYLETGDKSDINITDITTYKTTKEFNILYINIISFNTLFEFKYPEWKIQPCLKFGPRIDYTFIETPYSLDKFNYGFAAGGGLNYQLNEHFDFHADFIYNWYAKDYSFKYSPIDNPDITQFAKLSLNKNLCINLGIAYIF